MVKRVGLNAHTGKPEAALLVPAIAESLRAHGIEVCVDRETATLLPGATPVADEEFAEASDVVMILGGDGSILRALRRFGPGLPPLFGVNLGSLGFLVAVQSSAWREAVEFVVHENWLVSHRALLAVEILHGEKVEGPYIGLNDVVISRGEFSRLIRLQTLVDGKELTEYTADGLIICTPTGSTAYSLSAGGPVIDPEASVMTLTPICPHVLTNRSVVVPDHCLVEVRPMHEGPEHVFVAVDGQQNIAVARGDRIRIRKAEQRLPLATVPGCSFFDVLRQKLKWSGSAV